MPNPPHPIDPRRLPPQLRTLVATLGLAPAVRLLEARGGTRLHIARDPAKCRALPGLLDAGQVAALCAAWGGLRPTLPMPGKVLAQVRDAAIRADRRPNSRIALDYGMTVRRVQQIRNGAEEEPRQGDLFGVG